MFQIKTYSIKNITIITNEILALFISKFWDEVFSPLINNSDKYLMLMCKVQYTDSEMGYRTLGYLRKVNLSDKALFIDYLTDRLGLLNDAYSTHPISKITFSYLIKDGLATDNRALLQDLSDPSLTSHKFFNLNLPITMVPSEFGPVVTKPALYDTFTRYIATYNKRLFQIDVSLDNLINNVTVLGAHELKWKDTKLSIGFKREIGKSTLYFVDGELVLRKQQLNAKPFRKLSVDKSLVSNFVTMDIETINVDNKLIPYLISGYNGSSYITSYANSSMDQKDLFISFINQLLTFFSKGSKSLIVYAHNLSGFDGIFLMKHLLSYGKVEPLIFNGKLMSIKIRLNNKFANGDYLGKTIVFKDSYLLLPLSLRKLCLAFGITIGKGHFPFKLNDIFYTGLLPKFALWTGVSSNEYETLISKFTGKVWSFKGEAIKYCKLDCKCLHDILTQFNELIFNEFQINIHNSLTLTLPALAMRITHYLVKDSIYQILGNVESAIRESYTGGAVDVYKPHNRIGSFFLQVRGMFKKLFLYDVNSLYPTVMATHPMPVGKPVYFDGDIRKENKREVNNKNNLLIKLINNNNIY
jgi:hypothetical protein